MRFDNTEKCEIDLFKKCTCCPRDWDSQVKFLEDAKIRIIGYQPSFKDFAKGYIFFLCPCDTTLGLRIHEFNNLYKGPLYTERLTGVEGCPGHCLDKEENLEDCHAGCSGSYVRNILQIIKGWEKK